MGGCAVGLKVIMLAQGLTVDTDDLQTIQAARHDIAAFAPIYERYFGRIYSYCLRRLGNPDDAEDLTSQIFEQALRHLASFRGGSVAAWLFTIAHHAVINEVRRRRPHVDLDEVLLISDHPDPSEIVLEVEDRQRLQRLMAGLPDDQRDLLALRLAAGLNATEIGKVLGKRAGAVRVELHRIITRLRTRYQQEEDQL